MSLNDNFILSASPTDLVQSQQGGSKRSVACDFCRSKKVRCNGKYPCTNCVDRKRQCVIPPKAIRTKHKVRGQHKTRVVDRLDKLEAMMLGSESQNPPTAGGDVSLSRPRNLSTSRTARTYSTAGHDDILSPSSGGRPLSPQSERRSQASQPFADGVQILPELASFVNPVERGGAVDWSTMIPPAPEKANLLLLNQPPNPNQVSTISSMDCNSHDVDSNYSVNDGGNGGKQNTFGEEGSLSNTELSNWEYHGPKSYLSICSEPGVKWVTDRLANPSFETIAAPLAQDIAQRLKTDMRLSPKRVPEPSPNTAWTYSNAYFNQAVDAALGIVHRPWFETRLRALHNAPGDEDETGDDGDPGWYALRNTIYAAGCRIEMSRSNSLKDCNRDAWGYFENALSVHTEVLYFRTSMVGIQALTLMAYFCENITSPCLEYMLCSSALRLAHSKGLHRQSKISAKLSQDERSQRSLVFWAAYCLEKHIVSQSGRPSILDDEEINCQVPQTPIFGSSANLFYCDTLVRLAQLSSLAFKRVSSYQAFQKGAKTLVMAVSELDVQLEALKNSKASVFVLDAPFNPLHLPANLSHQQAKYLQYAYYNTVLDIHTALTSPWSQNALGLAHDLSLGQQVALSSQKVAETCRNAIMATQDIHIDASTPHPLTFFGPMNAFINLFIHILKFSNLPKTQSDVTLLNICAGHFARLEFATDSQMTSAFVTDVASLARKAVNSGQLKFANHPTGVDLPLSEHTIGSPRGEQYDQLEGSRSPLVVGQLSNVYDLGIHKPDVFDIEMDEWSFIMELPPLTDDMPGFFNS